MINISDLFLWPMKKLARKLGAEYILLKQDLDFSSAMRFALDEFKKSCHAKYPLRQLINKYIRNLAKQNLQGNEYIARVYDIEYVDILDLGQLINEQRGGGILSEFSKFKGKCHYGFLNALLVWNGLTLISGYTRNELKKKEICDVGSGSGELEEHLLSLGVTGTHLHSVDVSRASIERQKRLGINVYEGTIGILPATLRFDIIFLSYFIDYDNNQLATFASAIEHANRGAKIILEGRLPARFLVGQSDQQASNTVTRGRFAFEDARLISQAFDNLAHKVSRTAKLERLVVGSRYVYSHFGFSRLPSYFLVFKVV
ncbi:hypothetical protein A3C67_01425 [Candidatus Nomurabacteria bacterium RIFCSPHIGHO2_02_FULL_42_19]|uniref:Uncharacterized protein n=1 Tax=Candidatus Nomurabacteria bacterium RIFCSPHIGHO2_02_FULL_42_19 TaxID=1801756 RepID=A0A1F6W288_9BACT|nr:MAG: hypothetical protein A3C67_01425 [Candidatus Nomurabacteria bacterium RIFCSPHIGHO2_02_FULL_42_19]